MEKPGRNGKLSPDRPSHPIVLFLEKTRTSKILWIALILYITLYFVNKEKTLHAIVYGLSIFERTFLIFISVSLFVGLLRVWVKPGLIKKLFGKEAGLRGIVTASFVGTLIVGPFYLIFPILEELLSKGARIAAVASIISAWAIKTPWIPYGAAFLGWKFIILFNGGLFLFSLVEGYIIELFVLRTRKNV